MGIEGVVFSMFGLLIAIAGFLMIVHGEYQTEGLFLTIAALIISSSVLIGMSRKN